MNKGDVGKKILVVSVNWIGDVVFTTPFLKTLRESFPSSHITCLVHPRCVEVLETNKRINDIIIYDEEGTHKGLAGKLEIVRKLKSKKFDMAFILHQSFTKALLVYLSGVRERIGYATKNRQFLLTRAVPEPEPPVHKVEYFLNLSRVCGISPGETAYEYFVDDASIQEIKGFLLAAGLDSKYGYAVLCPGGNWDPKRWPRENFAKLADEVAGRFGVKVVLSGSKKDTGLVGDIMKLMSSTPIVSCGKFTIKQLAALFSGASFVVANDSGPMHIAVASGTRVVSIFGPTSPELTGPYGLGTYSVVKKDIGCSVPCYKTSCSEYRCMAAVTVPDVVNAIDRILNR